MSDSRRAERQYTDPKVIKAGRDAMTHTIAKITDKTYPYTFTQATSKAPKPPVVAAKSDEKKPGLHRQSTFEDVGEALTKENEEKAGCAKSIALLKQIEDLLNQKLALVNLQDNLDNFRINKAKLLANNHALLDLVVSVFGVDDYFRRDAKKDDIAEDSGFAVDYYAIQKNKKLHVVDRTLGRRYLANILLRDFLADKTKVPVEVLAHEMAHALQDKDNKPTFSVIKKKINEKIAVINAKLRDLHFEIEKPGTDVEPYVCQYMAINYVFPKEIAAYVERLKKHNASDALVECFGKLAKRIVDTFKPNVDESPYDMELIQIQMMFDLCKKIVDMAGDYRKGKKVGVSSTKEDILKDIEKRFIEIFARAPDPIGLVDALTQFKAELARDRMKAVPSGCSGVLYQNSFLHKLFLSNFKSKMLDFENHVGGLMVTLPVPDVANASAVKPGQ